jgi:hypothetical protein
MSAVETVKLLTNALEAGPVVGVRLTAVIALADGGVVVALVKKLFAVGASRFVPLVKNVFGVEVVRFATTGVGVPVTFATTGVGVPTVTFVTTGVGVPVTFATTGVGVPTVTFVTTGVRGASTPVTACAVVGVPFSKGTVSKGPTVPGLLGLVQRIVPPLVVVVEPEPLKANLAGGETLFGKFDLVSTATVTRLGLPDPGTMPVIGVVDVVTLPTAIPGVTVTLGTAVPGVTFRLPTAIPGVTVTLGTAVPGVTFRLPTAVPWVTPVTTAPVTAA